MHNKGSHTKYNIQPLIRHIRYWVQTQFSLFRCKVLHGTPYSIIYITWSNKNPSIRSHEENMKYFFQMINDCNFLYETKCIDHYQKCKFASMICKTRCPADTNTNDVEKTCIKNPNKIYGHWQYYKFLCISYISKYSNHWQFHKSCSCTKIEFFLMPGL